MTAADPSKRGKRRKKIEIKSSTNVESRQICFSKRRQGLFKKANDLGFLCGTEVAMAVFSPVGKPISCGHHTVDAILSRFLSGDGPAEPSPAAADPCELIKWDLDYWNNVLDQEMRQRGQLEADPQAPWLVAEPLWWGADAWSMGMAELREYENILLQHQFIDNQSWVSGPALV